MASKDHAAEAAAKAKAQYDEIDGGESIKSLLQAVKKAQANKDANRKLSKKETKAKLEALKKQARIDAELLAIKKKEAEALELENERLAQQAKDDKEEADKALRRETRLKALEEGRKRQQAQITKVKQLKRTVDAALKIAQAGGADEKRIKDLQLMQANLKGAWSALPSKFQFPADREAIALNDEIIEDLVEIAKTDKEEFDRKKQEQQQTPVTPTAPEKTKGIGPLGAALSMATRFLRNAGTAATTTQGQVGTFASNTSTKALVLAKRLVDNTGAISTHVAALGHDSKEWFAKKFGGMFSRLWRLIRNPGDMLKKAPGLLSNALGWGALFTTVLAPIIKGLYDELMDKFSIDFIKKKFEETKEWLYSSVSKWMESFFKWGKENVVDPVVNTAGDTVKSINNRLDTAPKSDEQKANIAALTKQAPRDTPELVKLRASYGTFKESGNSLTKFLARSTAVADLSALKKKGETIPADFAAKLQADGFDLKGAKIGNVTATPAVAAVASPTPAKAAVPTVNGAPADGKGTAQPITAAPKVPAGTGDAGASFQQASSPGGLAVSQIPNSVLDDASHGFNTGILAGY